jgi:hypothetical protein
MNLLTKENQFFLVVEKFIPNGLNDLRSAIHPFDTSYFQNRVYTLEINQISIRRRFEIYKRISILSLIISILVTTL